MQIQFEPKKLDAGEATFLAGIALAAAAKAQKADGVTKENFKAFVAVLADGIWSGIENETEES